MVVEKTAFDGLLLIKPAIYSDSRGCFFESWNRETFKEAGISADFQQDNQSISSKNVIRGLHFQIPPHGQGKLVRVVRGAVLDVAVDLRTKEKTYGQHYATELSETNHHMIYIPEGFAHGFLTLEENTIFVYKCAGLYNKASERAIRWDDPTLNISWGIKTPLVSEKDAHAMPFSAFSSPF